MKRILVPIDFSATSQKAFQVAVDIALKSGAVILLYHLYPTGKKSALGVWESIQEYNRQFEINTLKRLRMLSRKVLQGNEDVEVSPVVGRAPVVKNIITFSQQNHVDLIVMGTQGASGLKKITVGSVASKIMEQSEAPVLLIPERNKWTAPQKIIFATVINKADRKALPIIFDFAHLYDAVVTCVNFYDPKNAESEEIKQEFDMYAYAVQRTYSDARIQFQQLKSSSVLKSLENLHEQIPYDLMVMARRKLGFFERVFKKSFTKEMAFVTNQPLLVIPEE